MNKKLVLALALAMASGSSVVATVWDTVTDGATRVEQAVTWPVAQLLNLQNAPGVNHVLNDSTAGRRANVSKHSPRVFRLALTAALGWFGWTKREDIKDCAKHPTKCFKKK